MSRKTSVLAGLALVLAGAASFGVFSLTGSPIGTIATAIGALAGAFMLIVGFFSIGRTISKLHRENSEVVRTSVDSIASRTQEDSYNHLDGQLANIGEKLDAIADSLPKRGEAEPSRQSTEKTAKPSPLKNAAPKKIAGAHLGKSAKDPSETHLAFPRKAEETAALMESIHRSQNSSSSSPKLARDIRVAMIADEFTYYSFAPEFDVIRLNTRDWRPVFEKYRPEIFICESAWRGGNGSHRPWSGRIAASVNKPHENRADLIEILEHCHKNGIPTVYWNKEDPMYFPNRIYDFSSTAALFDFVFTTAEECVADYKKFVGTQNVTALPFAVQPKIFNPIGAQHALPTVNFAGTWYAKYPERGAAAKKIMDSVLAADYELVIYDRMYGSGDERYAYPAEYQKYTKPSIPYFEVAQSYKKSKFGITLNTVTDSKTMFARRVFELAASGSVVLSNTALGVKEFFGDNVLYADADENVLQSMNGETYERLQRGAMEIALKNTYTHRAEQILDFLDYKYTPADSGIAGLVTIDSIDAYYDIISQPNVNEYFDELLILVRGDDSDRLVDHMRKVARRSITVVSEETVASGREEIKDLIASTAVAIGDRQHPYWKSPSDLEFMRSHLVYQNAPIGTATHSEQRFTVDRHRSISGLVAPAATVGSILRTSADGIDVFMV